MFSQRQLCYFLILTLAGTGSAAAQSPFLPWNWFHKKAKTTQTSKASKAPSPVKASRPWEASTLIHTRAVFVSGGKVIAPADYATAILYNATDPANEMDVEAMDGARTDVARAQHVCRTFIPGRDLTTGPQGDIYFDYVYSGSYWIFVCAQVKFSGMAKPIWVTGLVPVQRIGFNEANSVEYNVPDFVQIVLDPYSAELNAKPEAMPTELAMLEEPPLPLKVPYVQPAPFPQTMAAPPAITATMAPPATPLPTAIAAPDAITAPSATLIRTPQATSAPAAIAAPTAAAIHLPGAKPAPAAITAPSAAAIRLPGATAAPAAITAPSAAAIRLPGATAAPPPIKVQSTTPVPTPQATPGPPPLSLPPQ